MSSRIAVRLVAFLLAAAPALVGCEAESSKRLALNVYLSCSYCQGTAVNPNCEEKLPTGAYKPSIFLEIPCGTRVLPNDIQGLRVAAFSRFSGGASRYWIQEFPPTGTEALSRVAGRGEYALDPNKILPAEDPLVYLAEGYGTSTQGAGGLITSQAIVNGLRWTGGAAANVDLMMGRTAKFNYLTLPSNRVSPTLAPGGLSGHSATVIPASADEFADRVLIAGGQSRLLRNDPLQRVWLRDASEFDPVRNLYVVTAPMPAPRAYHTASLVNAAPAGAEAPQWKVLVVGGATRPASGAGQFPNGGSATPEPPNFGDGVSEAALYDASSRTWTSVAPGGCNLARVGHSATVLKDGRVLIVGGRVNGAAEGVTAEACLYDPRSGGFARAAGSLQFPRAEHSATLLDDGRVMIIGGHKYDGAGSELQVGIIEIFSPRTAENPGGDTFALGAHGAQELCYLARSGHSALHLSSEIEVPGEGGELVRKKVERVALVGGIHTRSSTSAAPPAECAAGSDTYPVDIYIIDTDGRVAGFEVNGTDVRPSEDKCVRASDLRMFSTNDRGRRRMTVAQYTLRGTTEPVFLLSGGQGYLDSTRKEEARREAVLLSFNPAYEKDGNMPFCRFLTTRTFADAAKATPFPGKYCPALEEARSPCIFADKLELSRPRAWHTMANLGDGRILVTGGGMENYDTARMSEVFFVPTPNNVNSVDNPY